MSSWRAFSFRSSALVILKYKSKKIWVLLFSCMDSLWRPFFSLITEIRVVSEDNSQMSLFKMLESSSRSRFLDFLLAEEFVVSLARFLLLLLEEVESVPLAELILLPHPYYSPHSHPLVLWDPMMNLYHQPRHMSTVILLSY